MWIHKTCLTVAWLNKQTTEWCIKMCDIKFFKLSSARFKPVTTKVKNDNYKMF